MKRRFHLLVSLLPMLAWAVPVAVCLTGLAGLLVWLEGAGVPWPGGKHLGHGTAAVLVVSSGGLLLARTRWGVWPARLAAWFTVLAGAAGLFRGPLASAMSFKASCAVLLLGMALVFHTHDRRRTWAGWCAVGLGMYAGFHTMAHLWPAAAGLHWRPGIALPGSIGLMALALVLVGYYWQTLRLRSSVLVGICLVVLTVG